MLTACYLLTGWMIVYLFFLRRSEIGVCSRLAGHGTQWTVISWIILFSVVLPFYADTTLHILTSRILDWTLIIVDFSFRPIWLWPSSGDRLFVWLFYLSILSSFRALMPAKWTRVTYAEIVSKYLFNAVERRPPSKFITCCWRVVWNSRVDISFAADQECNYINAKEKDFPELSSKWIVPWIFCWRAGCRGARSMFDITECC